MIVYITQMDSIPANCLDCTMNCNLPISQRNYTKVLKPYLTKRHPQCPLRMVSDEHIEEVKSCK